MTRPPSHRRRSPPAVRPVPLPSCRYTVRAPATPPTWFRVAAAAQPTELTFRRGQTPAARPCTQR
jgi:hypothetical protein